MYLLIVLVILGIIITIQYKIDIHRAYDKLANYKTQTIDTKFGKMTYFDAGSGEAVLLSHGIFGGYDQAYESLQTLLGNGYNIEKFMKRTKTNTAIFETGGHMITGHGDKVSSAIKEFIEKTK